MCTIALLFLIFSLKAGRIEELHRKAREILPGHAWGPDVEKQIRYHPILLAAALGELDSVRYYIEQEKVDSNICDEDWTGRTPLMLAAEHNRFEVVEYLLQHGADVTKKGVQGWTALHYAVEGRGASDAHLLINLLIKYGALCNVKTAFYQYMPLDHAKNRNLRHLLLLGAQSADSIHFNCHYGQLSELMRSIIEKLSTDVRSYAHEISERDPEGNCALAYAAARRNFDMVSRLLEYGAVLNHRNNIGNTAYAHIKRILRRADLEEQERQEYQKIQTMLHQRACHIADVLKQLPLAPDVRKYIKSLC